MNPYAIVENIPIPDRKNNVLNLFFYHKYAESFSMDAQLSVFFAPFKDSRFTPEWGPEQNLIRFKKCQAKNVELFEHMIDVKVPDEFRG